MPLGLTGRWQGKTHQNFDTLGVIQDGCDVKSSSPVFTFESRIDFAFMLDHLLWSKSRVNYETI